MQHYRPVSERINDHKPVELRLCPAARTYACGDAAIGPSLVVQAIADGLTMAETIIKDHPEVWKQRQIQLPLKPTPKAAKDS